MRIDAATLRQAEELIESCEHCNPEGAVRALDGESDLDAEAIHDAVRRRLSFNMIHLGRCSKWMSFVLKRRPFDEVQFERRKRHAISMDPERQAYAATAEDNIFGKARMVSNGRRNVRTSVE